jgi:hypothetical protein
MRSAPNAVGTIRAGSLVALCACLAAGRVQAQVRGAYPLGMSAIGSGVLPASGITYSNLFLFYSRDQLRGPEGELLATGRNSVLMDMNTVAWVSGARMLGGARYSLSATLPLANNSLTSDTQGAVSGGGGLGDSFYQPVILGWALARADVKVAYGFLAPTGRYSAGAADNVGSGYWTHTLSAGQTVYLTRDRATVLSAFEMYEFHGTQESTDVDPGQNLDLDFSLTHLLTLREDLRLQAGLVGYAQWQTTDKRGPSVTPAQATAHYRVYALGVGSNLLLPTRQVILGLRYYDEFASRSTLQGYSVQISSTITF